jgi:uncharacterized protein YqjF (DUF2071 family)
VANALLRQTRHRPWPIPKRPWVWSQEWNRAFFLHWRIPVAELRPFVSEQLEIDTFDNSAWVSLVPFTMEQIRPRFFPPVSMISNFHEINLRTYVTDGRKPGVYFLSIQAGNPLSVWIAKKASGLPYETAKIKRINHEPNNFYDSLNKRTAMSVSVEYQIGGSIQSKSQSDQWLTERYCLYLSDQDQLSRYEIHHGEWPLSEARIIKLDLNYSVGRFELSGLHPDRVHYSPGVKVLAWSREKLAER